MSLSLLRGAERLTIARRISWTALLITTVVSAGCATKDATPRLRDDFPTPTPTPIVTATPATSATPTPTPGGATPTPTPIGATPTPTPRPATPTPSPTATPVPNTACTPIASLPAQTMNPAGGSLTLPPCAGYTGQIDYPSFTGNAGTISAKLVSSTQNVVWENDGVAVPLTNSGAFFYVGFELSSTNANDTGIQFGSNLAGAPASCGEIDGSFTNGTIYYAEGEFSSSGTLPRQLVQNSAGTDTYQAAGCTLANQPVSVGGPNAIILSTSEQFFDEP